MSPVTVTFVGSGDAFGSGGRLQTCIVVDGPGLRLAIDFGATSLAGLRQRGIDPNSIDAVALTHLHGDHCGGIPFLLMDAMLGARRTAPLTVVGPQGTREHLHRLRDVLFPGSGSMQPRFDLEFREIAPGDEIPVDDATLRAAAARHTRETHPLAYRLQIGGRSIAYTGDGELTEDLQRLVAGADLLIAECYFYDKPVKWHLNYPDIAALDARRVVLTHMHASMLAHADEVPEECAYDGYVVRV